MKLAKVAALAVNIVSASEGEGEKFGGKCPTVAVTSAPANRLYLVSSIAAGLIGRKCCCAGVAHPPTKTTIGEETDWRLREKTH